MVKRTEHIVTINEQLKRELNNCKETEQHC
jgi:hypothetical protein